MTATNGSKVRQRRRVGRGALHVTGLSLGTAPLGGLYRDLSDEEALPVRFTRELLRDHRVSE